MKRHIKRDLDEPDNLRSGKDGVKNRDQEPFVFFAQLRTSPRFSQLMIVIFSQIGKDDQKHHRIFNAVDIGPENSQDRQKPYFFLFVFQNIEENDNEKIGKKVRTH